MSDLFWLTDAQMARLEPFFPKSHGKPRVDDRRVLSGIIFINHNGLRWRDAPKEYGPHKTLYNRWKRWSDKGIFAEMLIGLAADHVDELPILEINQYLNALQLSRPHGARTASVLAGAVVRFVNRLCALALPIPSLLDNTTIKSRVETGKLDLSRFDAAPLIAFNATKETNYGNET
ncbi:transposase, partial [Epibacterium ulvae]|uniref:transposase n=1 Tax=Epibacterium ulvae TaxID=1156985 RepID=UPI00248F80CB